MGGSVISTTDAMIWVAGPGLWQVGAAGQDSVRSGNSPGLQAGGCHGKPATFKLVCRQIPLLLLPPLCRTRCLSQPTTVSCDPACNQPAFRCRRKRAFQAAKTLRPTGLLTLLNEANSGRRQIRLQSPNFGAQAHECIR